MMICLLISGRYGDALNPWGDILTVAQAWCVSKKDAVLAIGVPTIVGVGKDVNVFNVHRLYGPVTYPFLTTNWKFVWPTEGKNGAALLGKPSMWKTQSKLESLQLGEGGGV